MKNQSQQKINQFMRNKERGGLSVELMLYIGAIIGLIAFILLIWPNITNGSNITKFQTESAMISSAAQRWKKARSNYTGISIGELCKQNILTKDGTICGAANTGTATNPFGGNWTVAPASNPGLFVVTGTLPNDPDVIAELADAMAPTTRGNCQSASSCSTLTTTTTSVAMTY